MILINYFPNYSLVLAAWLKTRTNREKIVFSELFEQSFVNMYTWGTQTCEFMMDILQCNIIQQMLYILDGLVPYSKDIEQTATMSVAGSNEGEIGKSQIILKKYFISKISFLKLFLKTLSELVESRHIRSSS